jgi:DNA polymerase (family 10)
MIEDIPSIGKAIHAKIIEILETGGLKLRDELLDELGAGILDILRLSGVGPKKAGLFYRELGINDLNALKTAAASKKLQGLERMGEKSELKILRAIESFENLQRTIAGRHTLPTAWGVANNIITYLKDLDDIKDIEVAGSLRRWKETIGDVDILVSVKDGKAASEPVMTRFVAYPDVEEVLAKGTTKSSIVLKEGLQVDLRVVAQESFGAALQYFTGSKAHNVILRERAKKQGLKINEYGVFDIKTEECVASATEADIYKVLGLECMPPEIRHGRSELELAEAGKLPRLVERSDIRGDLHMHTTLSDGSATLKEMAEAAMAHGYEYIAITDHSKAVGIANGLDEGRLLKSIAEIKKFNVALEKKGVEFRVLAGTEVDIKADGSLDYSDEVLRELDIVVGAVHSAFTMEEGAMTKRIIKAMETGLVDILAHPTGRLIGIREAYGLDMEAVLSCANEYNIAMELNSYPERLDLNDLHLRMAKERGVVVSIATDSHATEQLNNMEYGLHTARRAWLEKEDVLNTKTLKGMREFLAKRR